MFANDEIVRAKSNRGGGERSVVAFREVGVRMATLSRGLARQCCAAMAGEYSSGPSFGRSRLVRSVSSCKYAT